MEKILEAKNLVKDFDRFRAVHDVSFAVDQGVVFGLLGPNGAGKTTTLRMLSGLLQPTFGSSYIAGYSMQEEQLKARRELGFLTGEMDLYRRLKPKELLRYFGSLYEVPKSELNDRVEHYADIFGINEFADRYCEKLSTGQKQRVAIVRTLIHDPKVVILDEPTTGLDIMATEFVLSFIQRMAHEEGKTVIFSTHHMDEVERLCDKVAIMHQGKMLFDGTLDEAKKQQNTSTLYDAFFGLVTQ